MKKILTVFTVVIIVVMVSIINFGAVPEGYTGWAKSPSTGNRYYYKDGARVTGVYVIKGIRYVFDNKGAYLGKYSANKDYTINFDNNYIIKIENDTIKFTVTVNKLADRKTWDFNGDPYFSLYVYKDGKFKYIPYRWEFFDNYGIGMDDDGVMHFSLPLSAFDYDFTPGLYRAKAKVGGDFERNEKGAIIWHDVRGEFFLN